MVKVVILKKYNPYWSFYYFAEQVEAALKRKGFDPLVIEFDEQTQLLEQLMNIQEPLYFITFVKLTKNALNSLFKHRPHRVLFWRVDPIEWTKPDIVHDEKLYIATVDRFEEAYIKSFHPPQNVLFIPHAADPLLTYKEEAERPIDVLFCASSYDHLAIEKKIDKLIPEAKKFVFQMIDQYTRDTKVTVTELVKVLDESERPAYHLIIDSYVRAKERYDLINSIQDAEIHLFGGTAFDKKEYPVRGWAEIFRNKPNVVIHPAISFTKSLEYMRQSKIVLNSMPFFKNGTHERVFNSLAVGALPLTNQNIWFNENFVNGEELVFFQKDRINDQINELLADESKRKEIVRKGHKKVMRDHTWDNRIDQIIRWYLHD